MYLGTKNCGSNFWNNMNKYFLNKKNKVLFFLEQKICGNNFLEQVEQIFLNKRNKLLFI
jgi:hypothetical protein